MALPGGVSGVRTRSTGDRERAQSNVIGLVLVIGLSVMGVTGLMLYGSTAMMDARTQSQVDAAEHAMTQLDSRFSLVALGSAERQGATVDLRSGASMTVDGDRGWMNVSVYNRTSNEVDAVILNTTLGAIRYENGGTSVSYQGGGVWKQAPGGGSTMISPPEFHYRTRSGDDPTLTLPLVVVRGNGSVPGEATVTRGQTIAKFPDDSVPDRTNPLEGGQINVTVHSEYYEAWGAFFESRTGGSVEYDHDREEVRIVLRIEQSDNEVVGGVVSGATNELLVRKHAVIDSYNSSDGPYGTGDDDNTIVSSGSVTLKKNAKVEGNLKSGGSVDLESGASVTGDITEGADVQSPRAVDWLIDDRREEIESSPDSSPSIDSTTDELTGGSPYVLTDGKYYLDEIDLNAGDELELDTSGGDIELVVDGDVNIEDAKVVVTGDNTSRIYVEGDLFPKNSDVTVSGDRSPGLWIYMNPDAKADMFSQAKFTGVLYGPGSGAEDGVDVTLKNKVEVYGAMVGEITDGIDQQQDVHYDEALAKEDPLAGYGSDQPTVTYMHVTVNRVNVSAR